MSSSTLADGALYLAARLLLIDRVSGYHGQLATTFRAFCAEQNEM